MSFARQRLFLIAFLVLIALVVVLKPSPLFLSTTNNVTKSNKDNSTAVATSTLTLTTTATSNHTSHTADDNKMAAAAAPTWKKKLARKIPLSDDDPDMSASTRSGNTNTTTINGEAVSDLPPAYKICRVDHPAPQLGQTKVLGKESSLFRAMGFYFLYQCAGPLYEDYIQKHQFPFVLQKRQADLKENNPLSQQQFWGQRPTMVPPSSSKQQPPQHIVIIGNSHTRQVIGALLCQYHTQIVSKKNLQPHPNITVTAMQYTLRGGTRLSMLINHAAFYSQRWNQNLLDILQITSLAEITAMILGSCNRYDQDYRTAKTWQAVFHYARVMPEHQVEVEQHGRGLILQDLMNEYPGPIVWHSMMAQSNDRIHHHNLRVIQNYTQHYGRTNLRSVHARQYLFDSARSDNSTTGSTGTNNTPGPHLGKECSSIGGSLVQDCYDPSTSTKDRHVYANGHKCMGQWGGLPDLVAWDIVEALWDVLS